MFHTRRHLRHGCSPLGPGIPARASGRLHRRTVLYRSVKCIIIMTASPSRVFSPWAIMDFAGRIRKLVTESIMRPAHGHTGLRVSRGPGFQVPAQARQRDSLRASGFLAAFSSGRDRAAGKSLSGTTIFLSSGTLRYYDIIVLL